jgi:hypothetical protein
VPAEYLGAAFGLAYSVLNLSIFVAPILFGGLKDWTHSWTPGLLLFFVVADLGLFLCGVLYYRDVHAVVGRFVLRSKTIATSGSARFSGQNPSNTVEMQGKARDSEADESALHNPHVSLLSEDELGSFSSTDGPGSLGGGGGGGGGGRVGRN